MYGDVQIYLSNQTAHDYENNFAVYFGNVKTLNCFGNDQCLGLKLVSDEVNQIFPLLF